MLFVSCRVGQGLTARDGNKKAPKPGHWQDRASGIITNDNVRLLLRMVIVHHNQYALTEERGDGSPQALRNESENDSVFVSIVRIIRNIQRPPETFRLCHDVDQVKHTAVMIVDEVGSCGCIPE